MSKSFQDRFFLVRLARDEKEVKFTLIIIGILLLLLLANSGYLLFLSQKKTSQTVYAPSISASPSAVVTLPPTVAPSFASPTNTSAVQNSTAAKEYFISLGSGSSNAGDWTDVPGVAAQIDFGNYPFIKEIHFEASVGIPTANESASVRLFNETDKHPVWYSEISLTDGQYISSNPIIYDKGQKLYQVQMKTSLQYTANLIQSRIHIVLQ